jgi:hypothetical protein
MVSIRTIDRLIREGGYVTLTDTNGDVGRVSLVERGRAYVTYRDTHGHIGKMHRSSIATIISD